MLSNFFSWVGQNKAGVSILTAGVVLLGLTAVFAGCSISDAIKVPVPKSVQQVTQSPPKITLRDAPDVRDEYVQNVSRELARFDSDISTAEQWRDVFANLLNTGITLGQDAASNSGFPLGGALALALGGIGGLFLPKPGTATALNTAVVAATDKGYDMGRTETLATLAANTVKAATVPNVSPTPTV